MKGKEKIIGESRASKYIIPFSREVTKVGDQVFCYMTLDGRITEHKGGFGTVWSVEEKKIKHWRSGIIADFSKHSVDSIYPQGLYIDRTPSHIVRLYDRFMDWLESLPSD